MKLIAALLLALVVPASAAAALEVKLSTRTARPQKDVPVTVQLRPYWTRYRPDGSCCRLVQADVNYPFKVEAVSPSGRVFTVRVRRTKDRYLWAGSFRFNASGRWILRDPHWGPRYSRNYGARPRIAVTVR